ncbi:MAG: hypothetical protein ACTSRZ_07045 [Promethearchaeota archaeon]
MNVGQEKRLRNFLDKNNASLIIEATQGLYGVEYKNLGKIIEKLLKYDIDAIILSPGGAKRNLEKFKLKRGPALIIRADWSNYMLTDHPRIPMKNFRQTLIASAEKAIKLGASALICDFFFGVNDSNIVENIKMLQGLIEESDELGLPIIASIIPFGQRITNENYFDVILLGMRIGLELGSTIAAIPLFDPELKIPYIESSIGTPLLINSYYGYSSALLFKNFINSAEKIKNYGIKAFILDVFNLPFKLDYLNEFKSKLMK